MTDLTVCKDCGVVSLETAFNKLLSTVAVNSFLLGVQIKNIVVGERFVFAQNHLRLPRHHKCADVASFNLLFGQLRTNPVSAEETLVFLKQPQKNKNKINNNQ